MKALAHPQIFYLFFNWKFSSSDQKVSLKGVKVSPKCKRAILFSYTSYGRTKNAQRAPKAKTTEPGIGPPTPQSWEKTF